MEGTRREFFGAGSGKRCQWSACQERLHSQTRTRRKISGGEAAGATGPRSERSAAPLRCVMNHHRQRVTCVSRPGSEGNRKGRGAVPSAKRRARMTGSRLIAGVLLLTGSVAACGGGGTSQPPVGDVTFWQDVAPIYNDKCARCHQEGGIAPFRLDNYADAKANAALEKQRTAAGTMPPYFIVNDGSCQNFVDDTTLTGNQKAIIAA